MKIFIFILVLIIISCFKPYDNLRHTERRSENNSDIDSGFEERKIVLFAYKGGFRTNELIDEFEQFSKDNGIYFKVEFVDAVGFDWAKELGLEWFPSAVFFNGKDAVVFEKYNKVRSLLDTNIFPETKVAK